MPRLGAQTAAGAVAAAAGTLLINGAGATFPFPLYSKWADAYKKETGNGLNYQSIGSGAGIKQIVAKTERALEALRDLGEEPDAEAIAERIVRPV